MTDNQNYLDKLVKTVYSKWLSKTYGISSAPLKIEGCELTKYYLKFKLLQKEYEPQFNV